MQKLSTLVVVLVLAAVAAPALAAVAATSVEQAGAADAAAESGTGETTETTGDSPRKLANARKRESRKLTRGSRYLMSRINRHRRATWRWQEVMGKPRTPSSFSAKKARSKDYRQWVLRLWKKRHAQVRRRAQNPPNKWAWLCLNRYEGAWTANTGNGYYGGLQMDLSFQRAYGAHLLRRKGTANNWTPLEQMWVAERALRAGRGFYPWPNAARMCGLI